MRKSSNFLSRILLVCLFSAAMPGFAQTNYYSKTVGNLDQLANWGTLPTGAGTAPGSFTAANQVFNIRNNAAPTIGANWTVSGAGSKIIVGDGTNPCNFQIPSGFRYTGTADVSAVGTLSIANTTIPTLGVLNTNSTVVYNGTASQTIPLATYGNMTYSGSAFGTIVAGGCTINGTLNVTNGTLQLDNYTTQYTYTILGNLNVTGTGTLDLGSNGSATGQMATINLSGNLIQSGTGLITTSGNNTQNGIINFVGTNQNIEQVTGNFTNYNITSGSTCTLSNNFAYNGQSGIWVGAYFTINSGGTLDCGTKIINDCNIAGVASSQYSNFFILNSGGNLITANTLGITSSGATGSIQMLSQTYSSGANYTYNGTAAQITGIFTTASGALNTLTINNAAGVTLSQSENLISKLILTNGLLTTTAARLLTLNNNATCTGASNSSFVNGPVQKIGSQAFTFPVGVAGTGYVPIAISAPASSTNAWLAQYNRSSAAALGPVTAFGLSHVSSCDYWTLNHTAGTNSVNVTGYWSINNLCGAGTTYINNIATVCLAHFNGTSWDAWGNNGGTTGTATAGSVTWNTVSTFSPFSLASTDLFNPLPITLTGFNAQWNGNSTVGLTWKTEQELNSNHFTIQRCSDGVSWQPIGMVPAKGTSNTEINYAFTDPVPLPGMDYYRLQIVDNDGNFSYSDIKTVSTLIKNIRIFPNPANDHINITLSSGNQSGMITIRLLNVEGKVLVSKEVHNIAGETISLPVSMYPQGIYLVQVVTPGNVQQSGTVIIRRN